MDRAAWARAGIVVAILVLLALILITPNLIGRPPELGSLPLLIVGLTQDRWTFVVDVGGGLGRYMYANVTLEVRGIQNASYDARAMENDTYDVHLRVPVNATASFAVHTYLVDRQENYFEYNVTVDLGRDPQGRFVFLVVTLPDEKDVRVERRTLPEDFRWPVPLRGAL